MRAAKVCDTSCAAVTFQTRNTHLFGNFRDLFFGEGWSKVRKIGTRTAPPPYIFRREIPENIFLCSWMRARAWRRRAGAQSSRGEGGLNLYDLGGADRIGPHTQIFFPRREF
jgi:hypothetical protein